jgi:hypothetical protein
LRRVSFTVRLLIFRAISPLGRARDALHFAALFDRLIQNLRRRAADT